MWSNFMGVVVSNMVLGTLLVMMLILPGVIYGADAPKVTVMAALSEGMVFPTRLAMDAAGNSYVADSRGRAILKYNQAGNLLLTIRTSTPVAGIAVTADGKIVVSQGDFVAILDASGTETGRLGKGAGQFKMANGIAIDGEGYIYVVDSLANSVQVFYPSGMLKSSFGSYGTRSGQFSSPTGIAYEKISNQLVVADSLNGRVQFFDTSGVHQKTLGGSISSPVQFTSPQGIAFEYTSGPNPVLIRMYIVDTFQNLVQVVDPSGNGTFLSYVGEYGTANGKLIHPSDALFDKAGNRLIVANGKGNLTVYGIDIGIPPVDTTPPMFSITYLSSQTDVSAQTIGGNIETGASIAVKVNTTAQIGPVSFSSSNNWQCTINGLAPGDNVLSVTARDAAGNSSSQIAIVNYRLPPPLLAINQLPAMTGTIYMNITGTVDEGSIVNVSNATTGTSGAATVTGTSWSYPVTLVQGSNIINVTAQRPFSTSASDSRVITLDSILPALSVSALTDKSNTTTQTQNITGLVSDENLQSVTINGQPTPVVNGLFSSALNLTPGNNLITVKAEDLAGNSSTDIRDIYFETTKPVITITSPADGLCTNKNIVTFSGQVNNGASVLVGGSPALMNGNRWTATVILAEGLNTIEVIAVDHKGNSSSLKRTIILNFLGPELYITNPGQDLATNKSHLVFIGTVAGTNNVSLSYSVNGDTALPVIVSNGKYRFPLNLPAKGMYRVAITAADEAGNTCTSVRTLLYDNTKPKLTISTSNVPGSARLKGTVEPGATVTVTDKHGAAGTVDVNNGAWIAELAPGYNLTTLLVTATDAAGNTTKTVPYYKKAR